MCFAFALHLKGDIHFVSLPRVLCDASSRCTYLVDPLPVRHRLICVRTRIALQYWIVFRSAACRPTYLDRDVEWSRPWKMHIPLPSGPSGPYSIVINKWRIEQCIHLDPPLRGYLPSQLMRLGPTTMWCLVAFPRRQWAVSCSRYVPTHLHLILQIPQISFRVVSRRYDHRRNHLPHPMSAYLRSPSSRPYSHPPELLVRSPEYTTRRSGSVAFTAHRATQAP